MKNIYRFILLDDNESINILNKLIIKKIIDNAEIQTFCFPEEGLDYISSCHSDDKTAILLDINMSTMSSWEFLDKFDQLDDSIKKQYNIYILSAYIKLEDRQWAEKNKNVINFFEKPLTKELVQTISHFSSN